MMHSFINLNGELLPSGAPVLTPQNRAFRYGDGLFESIRVLDGRMPFLERHWSRLSLGMRCFKMDLPHHYSAVFFKNEIAKLTDNQGNWRVRLSVFRGGGGLYAPLAHAPAFLIETSPLDSQKFDLNLQGMAIGVFDEIRLPTLAPSQQFSIQNFKTHSALPFVLAAIFKQEKGWGECLLLNQRGRLACGSSSNVFLVKNGSLFTPPLSEGCVAGTMRSLVLALAKAKGMGVGEKRLRPQDLGAAEEVFLTNAIQGIRWVAGYGGSVYDNKVAEVLHQAIIAVAAHGG